jgi:2-polyprenyl-3-methyl-5-hydroxy-6-metoxy-1,4-benzoquinol methylase
MDGQHAGMEWLLDLKYGPASQQGWSPLLRRKFGYVTPDDRYEETVAGLVANDTEWLDVGGGSTLFPRNPKLGQILAGRCTRLVAVDPSDNVTENELAHERHQCFLEEFQSEPARFTLATARMVVEHVTNPASFVAKLGQLVKPGGDVVIYTVSRWAPMTILSGCTPMGIHHFAKRVLWKTEEKDTFPVAYLMNTRDALNRLFTAAGFHEVSFNRLDDCRTLARWKTTATCELLLWKALRAVGLRYPESCILTVYRRNEAK